MYTRLLPAFAMAAVLALSGAALAQDQQPAAPGTKSVPMEQAPEKIGAGKDKADTPMSSMPMKSTKHKMMKRRMMKHHHGMMHHHGMKHHHGMMKHHGMMHKNKKMGGESLMRRDNM